MQEHQVNGASSNPIGERAQHLFEEQSRTLHWRLDRMFAVLMAFQWAAAILAALWVSPRAWVGAESQLHPHVWTAMLLGGIIALPAILLGLFRPSRVSTRHAIGVCQMLMGGLFIHLSGGRIETHFHVFGSLAFLAFYRDWRVLVSASAVVVVDHLARGFFWPQSIFGTALASDWRWLEHAGWVIFEDAFLILSCRQSIGEMSNLAERQAQLEATQGQIEATVQQRTAELMAQTEKLTRTTQELRASEAHTQAIIEAAVDGIIAVDEADNIRSCNSAAARLFGYPQADLIGRPASHFLTDRISRPNNQTPDGTGRPRPNALPREARGRRQDGAEFPLELSISALHGETGSLWMGILRDISERKEEETRRNVQFAVNRVLAESCVAST